MHHGQAPQLGYDIHRFCQMIIIGHPPQLGVGHEHLKRRNAHFKALGDIPDLIFRIKHGPMNGEIGIRGLFSFIDELFDRLVKCHARFGISIMDHCRDTAEGTQNRAIRYGIDIDGMDMHID